MKAIFTLILLLSIDTIQAKNLNICINRELESKNVNNIDQDIIAKEILFKNVYESLFYFSKSTNKIKSNIAKKIEPLSKDRYRLVIDKEVAFHTNSTFFVKKNLDYKDVIFSLKNNSNIKDFKIDKKGLEFSSILGIKDLYIELSSPKAIIKSKAYWSYLQKKKKQDLFYSKPIGTGPFHIEKIQSSPYILNRFERYHLSNKLNTLKYIVTTNYVKDLCDIFWDYEYSQKKVFSDKYSYQFHESEFNNLVFMVNSTNNKWINSIIDPLKINSIILKDVENKITSLPIPLDIKKSYLINRKVIAKEKAPMTVKFSFTEEVLSIISLRAISINLNRYFKELNINFLLDDKNPDIIVDIKYDLDKLDDLNNKVLCPYKSISCNKIDSLKLLEEILLKEKRILPIGFIKRSIFYKKNIKNINFNFKDSIDYSEVRV